MSADVISISRGLHTVIYAKKSNRVNIYNKLMHFYQNNDAIEVCKQLPLLDNIVGEEKIFISVEEDETKVIFKIILDNLMVGVAISAIENAKRLFKD